MAGRESVHEWNEVAPFVTPISVCRFWTRVDRAGAGECWEWTGPVIHTGYGCVTLPHFGRIYAHRFAFGIIRGGIPSGMLVLHRCDNRVCCNPAHMYAGTHDDNMRDMNRRGRNLSRRRRVTVPVMDHQDMVAKVGDRAAFILESLAGTNGFPRLTAAAIGRRYGISRERVRQIKDKALVDLGLVDAEREYNGILPRGGFTALAQQIGCSIATVSQVVNGRYVSPTSKLAKRIKQAVEATHEQAA